MTLREVPGSSAPHARPASERSPESERVSERAASVVCADCGNFVTTVTEKTSVDGRHQHRFMNPDGLHFEIVCFSRAPGAVGVGESSSVWTWFPGYVWQAVVCSACVRHLGWSYSRGADGFFGLITARIVELSAHPD
ncbi:MAG TPA: cereblon family protein [Polyangiaceae bacterium]|nr:cereblon family protein [Polyangiaceae bacterium]